MITFPLLDGSPPRHPWSAADALRTLDLIDDLGQQLTPSPWPEDEQRTRHMIDFFTGWRRLNEAEGDDPWRRDSWITDHFDELLALEQDVRDQLPGNTLSHFDLRADNIVITADQLWIVDWAHTRNAARWVDPMILVTDIVASGADRADGGEIDVSALLREHPALAPMPTRLQYGFVAALAAALHVASLRPPAPGLPTIRRWQAGTSESMIMFLRRQPTEVWLTQPAT